MAAESIKEISGKALLRIKPEKEQFKEVDDAIAQINSLLKHNKLLAECMAGGSYAKGTILKNDFDIDLFVRFDYSYKDKDISALLAKVLEPLNPTRIHGSRDYFQLRKGKSSHKESLLFEIIPVLNIDNYKQAVNVTDMSPLHVGYARKRFAANPGLADEVRLAKQFCKSAGIYGAESYIRGFSGHVLDMLLIFYGSFEKFLMQASLWGSRVIIDLEGHLKNPLAQLNKSKTQSPIIIVDPMQPDRNAAAAVSREKFYILKKKARKFLHQPAVEFFEIKKLSPSEINAKAKNQWLVLLKVKPLQGNEDVVGTKVLKVFEHIQKHLRKHDFSIIEYGWGFQPEESILYYIISKEELSGSVMLYGPPVKEKTDAKRFRQKHKKVIEKNNRLFAEEKRKYKKPEQLVKDLLREDYVKGRAEKISFWK